MVKNIDKLRICLAASAGGHMSQLLALKDSWKGHTTFYVTTTQILRNKLENIGKVYIIRECNRQNLFRIICVFFQCINITWQEHPHVVVSTGATPGFLMCLAAKLLGAKVVWIDSIANVEELSLSGRLVRPLADLCLTQWEDIENQYARVEYAGAII